MPKIKVQFTVLAHIIYKPECNIYRSGKMAGKNRLKNRLKDT